MDTGQFQKQVTFGLWKGFFSSLLTWWPILVAILMILAILQASQRRRILTPHIQQLADRAGTIRYILAMSWDEFECLCRLLFENQGFHVNLTRILDDGVHLIGSRDAVKVAALCTRFTDRTVAATDLQRLCDIVEQEGAGAGYFLTTSEFSQAAIDLAHGKPLTLIDKERLAVWMARHASANALPENSPPAEPHPESLWDGADPPPSSKHYVCSGCGQLTTLSSEPARGEPVYCNECRITR